MQLLDALDALVHADAHPPMMRGKVTIGVRGAGGYRFWSAALDQRATTSTSAQLPGDSAVTLFLDEADAAHILATGRLPDQPRLLSIDGDRRVLTRFLARYTGGAQSALQTRVAVMRAATPPREARGKPVVTPRPPSARR